MTPTRAARVSSLRSMTGFGRAEVSAGPVAISVEARSLNHRHLDVTLRLPRALADLEMDARRLIQSRLERGRVEIAVQLSPAPDTPGQKISVDQALAAQYVARARGAHPAPRAPRAVCHRARRGRGRGSAARLPDPGAEPRGQHDRREGRRPRGQSGGPRSEGPDREDARAGAKS